jgi:hypothetical protein
MWNNNPILTFIINLEKRTDRREHILVEFRERNEFKIAIKEAVEHEIGAMGLWMTIVDIIRNVDKREDYILICEDDHRFTDHYSAKILFQSIEEAQQKGADILSGGVSWLNSSVAVSENLFWVEDFSGLQFTVIFRKFFKTIVEAVFEPGDAADYKISSLTNRKFFIHPFISTQKEFGYSDVTTKNGVTGHVDDLFNRSDACVQILKNVSDFYHYEPGEADLQTHPALYDDMAISTFVLNSLPGNDEHLAGIRKTFYGKTEFDVRIVDVCTHENNNIGKWMTVRRIIELAIVNDDDLVLLCGDDHLFTDNYSRDFLWQNIVEAHAQGAGYLSGGAAGFNYAVQIAEHRFWIDPCLSSSFFIIYKNLFQKILEESFYREAAPEKILSDITSSKMVIYPFISGSDRFTPFAARAMKDRSRMASANTSFPDAESRLAEISTVNTIYSRTRGKIPS